VGGDDTSFNDARCSAKGEGLREWFWPTYGSLGGRWYAFGGEPGRTGRSRPCETDLLSFGWRSSRDMLLKSRCSLPSGTETRSRSFSSESLSLSRSNLESKSSFSIKSRRAARAFGGWGSIGGTNKCDRKDSPVVALASAGASSSMVRH
jgi:hypothetical protein